MPTLIRLQTPQQSYEFAAPEAANLTDGQVRRLARRLLGPLFERPARDGLLAIESLWVDRFTDSSGRRTIVLSPALLPTERRSA